MTILNARRLGPSDLNKVQPIEVTLSCMEDKTKIYKNVKNLKGAKNSKGFGYQIRNQLPERLQEEDTRMRQLMGRNNAKARQNTAHNISMSIKRNKLMINNTVYKKIALCGLRWFKLNVSKCQKDAKLSKRCQMSNSQTSGLWRRFGKKINGHNEVHRY